MIGWCANPAPWCSGLTCHPVTVEIRGSNPLGVAHSNFLLTLGLYPVFSSVPIQSRGEPFIPAGQHRCRGTDGVIRA